MKKTLYCVCFFSIFMYGLISPTNTDEGLVTLQKIDKQNISILTDSEMAVLSGGQCDCNPSIASCPPTCVELPINVPGTQSQSNCACKAYTIYKNNGC